MTAVETSTTRAGRAPSTATATFRAIGTTIRLVVTRPDALEEATALTRAHLDALDLAVSRFRSDSEVSRLARAAERGPASAVVSPVFAGSLRAGLRAARLTGGLVDPTVGRAVAASGYDDDLDAVRARPASPAAVRAGDVPGWRSVSIDPVTDRVDVPRGCLIDLGATAKAHAADVLAERLAALLPGGVLVNLGGDIAVGGQPPEGGWRVAVEDGDEVLQVISLSTQAVTTSSTRLRTWQLADGGTRHHIVDPRTGRTAPDTWAQVTCVAGCALEANTASTAAVVLGDDAPAWLEANGIPARLDAPGRVVTTTGWPQPAEEAMA
jgi:thiamine biosynthesis lipoprotein